MIRFPARDENSLYKLKIIRDDVDDDEDVWHSASSDSSGWLNSDLRRPAAADDLPRPAVTEEDGVLPRLAARDEGAGV